MIKLTPHEFQTTLNNLMSSESEVLSELLFIAGVRAGDIVESADFSELNITNDNLNSLGFVNTNFKDSNFTGSNLDSASIRNCIMEGVVFGNNSMVKCTLANINIAGEFSDINLESSRITMVRFNGCVFKNSILMSATVISSELVGSEVRNSNLRSIKLIDTKIENVNFFGTSLNYAALEGLIFKKVSFSNCMLDEANFIGSRFDDCYIDSFTSVVNTKFSRDCGLTPAELNNLESRGATLIDDPNISPNPVRSLIKQRAAG